MRGNRQISNYQIQILKLYRHVVHAAAEKQNRKKISVLILCYFDLSENDCQNIKLVIISKSFAFVSNTKLSVSNFVMKRNEEIHSKM